jgi:hypothetical protein
MAYVHILPVLTSRLTSPHLLWLKLKRDENGMTPASRRIMLEDIYARFHQHLSTWFPEEGPGGENTDLRPS